jgi:hypothetical protein
MGFVAALQELPKYLGTSPTQAQALQSTPLPSGQDAANRAVLTKVLHSHCPMYGSFPRDMQVVTQPVGTSSANPT